MAKGSVCQGGPRKTGMQPVKKASVRRWLDWLLPGRMRQNTLVAMASSIGRCGCTFNSFKSKSRSVHATCQAHSPIQEGFSSGVLRSRSSKNAFKLSADVTGIWGVEFTHHSLLQNTPIFCC